MPQLHVYHHVDERVLELLAKLNLKGNKIMADLSRLVDAVTRVEDRGDALIALVEGLAEEIRQTAGNQAEANALADRVEAQAQELSDAVDANTAPPPVE